MNMKNLGIDQLTIDERIELVEAIWGSIAAETAAISLTETQAIDLQRCLAEHYADPNSGSTWDEVRRRVQN